VSIYRLDAKTLANFVSSPSSWAKVLKPKGYGSSSSRVKLRGVILCVPTNQHIHVSRAIVWQSHPKVVGSTVGARIDEAGQIHRARSATLVNSKVMMENSKTSMKTAVEHEQREQRVCGSCAPRKGARGAFA
jgi:hypothetical protein